MTDPSDDFVGNLADIPGLLADSRHILAIISVADPVLLDLVDLALAGQDAVVICAELHFGVDGNEASSSAANDDLVRLVSHSSVEGSDDEPVRLDVPMPSTCPACSLREVLTAVAQDCTAQDPDDITVILLPAAVELAHLLPDLIEEFTSIGVRLAGTARVLDATAALDELFEHCQPSALPGNARYAGAVHLINLGYADLVLTLGRDEGPAGADLIEHLCPHDTLLLPGLDTPLLETLTTLTHDVATFLSRIHPATTNTWSGPDEHGVWTLDLSASLPFHPRRLRSLAVELTGQGLCARNCFWSPSRPGRVCTWEVAGSIVSVGDTGTWAKVPTIPSGTGDGVADEPRSHLVVTGVGDEEICEQVRRVFSRVPLRPEEVAQALAWTGADGGPGGWFGQEG